MKRQTQEQGPPAGHTVRKISLNVRVKKMQRNDKKIKQQLNEHIRKWPHQKGNSAGYAAARRDHPEFTGFDRYLFLAPVCLNSGSHRGHQSTRSKTVKQIQCSEAYFYILYRKLKRKFCKKLNPKIIMNHFTLQSEQ